MEFYFSSSMEFHFYTDKSSLKNTKYENHLGFFFIFLWDFIPASP